MWLLNICIDIRIRFGVLFIWLMYVERELLCQVLDQSTEYIPEDQTMELKCQNKTGGRFAHLVWTSNAYAGSAQQTVYAITNDLKIDIRREFKDRVTIFNGTSIRITDSRIGDSGTWECNIIFQYTPPDGGPPRLRVRELAVYKVIVVSPPKHLQLSKSSLAIRNYQQDEIYCDVQASSPFNITWRKIGGNFTTDVQVNEEEKQTGGYFIKRKYLKFKRFSKDDAGTYECHAKNIGGEVSQLIGVRMQTSPMIYSKDSFNINVYDTGKIVCEAKGYPLITFIWKFYDKDGDLVELHSTDRNGQFSASYNEYNADTEIGTSKLTIEQVQKGDLKIYECIARNAVGTVSKEIRLTGFAPPDAPIINKSRIKAHLHKVKLVWTLGDNGGKPITSITIKYKNSSSTTDWTRLQITQSFTEYTVTNIQSGTSYDFKVLATNEIGDSEYSAIVNAATSIEVKSVPVKIDESANFFGKFSPPALIGIFGGAFIALIIGFVCICVFVRRMQKRDAEEAANQHASIGATTSVLPQHSMTDGVVVEMEQLFRKTDEWEFPRDRLTITTVLGAGAFGIVMRGLSQGIKGSVGQITVAVKTVRDTTNEAATKDLVAELNLLKLIPEHPNVLGLLGCCTRTDPLYVIVEYCANGDLQGFLRSSRGIYERYYKTSYGGAIPNLTSKMLLTFAWQVAKGMAHLSTMKVIHRDLAARNILVDDQLVCKVSDFGFARDIYVEDHYLKRSAGGRFPIKWMAIESLLDGISTTKSDVWSFGVVLWELVTLGASPYPGMSSYEVVSFLQDGYRMDKPKHAASEIYALMMDCWSVSPGRRPSFNTVAERFQDLVEDSDVTEFINMTFYQDHLYVNFDGTTAGSAAASTASTPHGTLGRSKDRINSIQQPLNGLGLSTPRTLRSTSQVSVRSSGRSNSVPGLSERSTTGVSTISYRDERAALLPPIPQ